MNHLEYSSFIDCFLISNQVPFTCYVWIALAVTHRKVSHIRDEDVDLDDLLDTGASSREDSLQVLDARSRLLLNGTIDQVALGVTRNLAGAVNSGGGLDGLRL